MARDIGVSRQLYNNTLPDFRLIPFALRIDGISLVFCFERIEIDFVSIIISNYHTNISCMYNFGFNNLIHFGWIDRTNYSPFETNPSSNHPESHIDKGQQQYTIIPCIYKRCCALIQPTGSHPK